MSAQPSPSDDRRPAAEPATAATPAATAAEPLVVYGAGWCPDVRRSRALLDADGVDYRYVDVEADPQGAAFVRQLQGGARRIPTIVRADGAHLVEPSDDALRSWLTERTG